MTDTMNGRWRVALWSFAAGLLLLPLVAMQFTREVAWDGADFLVFGAMLVIACGAFELAVRVTRRGGARVLAGLAIVSVFPLVWAELAVSLFD